MKRTYRFLASLTVLTLLFGLLSGMTAFARTSSARDFEFDPETGTITAYHGGDEVVVIPSSISGKDVRVIGERAFFRNADITTVVVPESVTDIEIYAFAWCSSLSTVYLPPALETIGAQAFAGSGITSEGLHIPVSVTRIGDEAFGNCQSVRELVIPGSADGLNGVAAWSESLTSCVIMEDVTTMTAGCFDGCTSLEQVYIPSTLTSVQPDGDTPTEFGGCTSLRSVYFGGTSLRNASSLAPLFAGIPAGCTVYFPASVSDEGLAAMQATMLSCGLPESVTVTRGGCPFYPQDYESAPLPTDIAPKPSPNANSGISGWFGAKDETDGDIPSDTISEVPEQDENYSVWALYVGAGIIAAVFIVLLILNRKKLRARRLKRKTARKEARRRAEIRRNARRAAEQRRINRLNGYEDDPNEDDPLEKYRRELGDMEDDF